MKLKKRYIILILIIILTSTFVFFHQKDILISDIFNKNNKLATYTFQTKPGCDNWIDANVIPNSDMIYDGGTYIILDAKITNIGYEGFVFVKKSDGCTESDTNIFNNFGNKENSCSAMKTFVLNKPFDGLNRYNYNYWVRQYNNICAHDKLNEKFEIECDVASKNEIIESNDVNKAKKFNSLCPDEVKIRISTITLDWQGGWGPNTLGTNWNGSDGIYETEGIVGKTQIAQFDKKLVYHNFNLIGWSKNENCSTSTIIGSGGTNHTFTFENSNVTYYACYEESTTSELFKSDNTKKTIDIKSVNENESCSDTDMKVTNSYYRKTTKVEPYKTKLRGNNTSYTWDDINPYCNVVCEDDVKVSYPSIFETVPAGQYFELMYEPEITATRTCMSEFNYDKWETAYKEAIDDEIDAMNELNKAKANLKAAKSLTCPTGTCTDHADTINADGSICSGCGDCVKWKSSDDNTEEYYHSENSYKQDAEKQSVSATSTESASDAQLKCNNAKTSLIGNETSGLTKTRNEKINAYKDAVTKRIKLEQNNYQCYTILDQDNNEYKYSDVFEKNYKYGSIDVNETEYELKTPIVSADVSNSSTSTTYASYIDNVEITTTTLQQLNNTPIGSTVNFYAVYPKLIFKYDNGSKGSPEDKDDILSSSEKNEEILSPEAHVKLDTGAFTPNSSGNYTKDSSKTNSEFKEYFYVDGDGGYHIHFKAYTAKTVSRQVQYYFKYREPKEYYSKKHNGAATSIKPIGEAYISLSKIEKLTDKDNDEIETLNHVYPVDLKAVEGNYYNGIILSNYQNMTNSNTDSNSYFKKSNFGSNFKGVYSCDYNITNDALKLSGETETYKDLKSNTIFRSVSTNEIDPNDREATGNLGENWINAKGSAVRKLIKSKETHDGVTKDTYNEKNLEYSFTLTPKIISAIKEANSKTNYDDFNLDCTDDGRECTSVFLTYLSDGKIINPDTIHFENGKIDNAYSPAVIDTYSNYYSLNSWNSDDLNDIRKEWKYYIEDISLTTTDLQNNCEHLGNKIYSCKQGKMNLDTYNKIYETWGVLP